MEMIIYVTQVLIKACQVRPCQGKIMTSNVAVKLGHKSRCNGSKWLKYKLNTDKGMAYSLKSERTVFEIQTIGTYVPP